MGFWRKKADQPRPGNVALNYLEGSEKFHELAKVLVTNLGTTSRRLLMLAGAVAESPVETLAGLALAPKGVGVCLTVGVTVGVGAIPDSGSKCLLTRGRGVGEVVGVGVGSGPVSHVG